MARITARFYVDGKQVDEVDADVPETEDALGIVKVLKESVPETVSSMTAEVKPFGDLMERLRRSTLPQS